MAGVKGKTGNPGIKNPKKRNETSFAISPQKEPKSNKIMGFKPSITLEERIKIVIATYSLSQTDFLEQAAIAYLEILERK
jgi:hypothetical protein